MHAFFQKKRWIVLVVILIGLAAVSVMFFNKEQKIDFNAQIRPILNKNCIACHGGVKQSGGFSVLFREEALGNTESGKPAILPGDPEHSEFIRRITTHDIEERMPLEKNPLSQQEIDLLRTWVKQGAVWDEHWAFKKPLLPEVPEVNDSHHRINEIDNFIIEKLEPMGLAQSPQAAKSTLLRRASLDLIGCLPDPQIRTRYLNDSSDKAYEHLVDDLLASPKYGEKWTSLWLDLSRYADSKGYEKDMHRETWPYRDWLIRSLNSDMPYDEFITEQLAGDLLLHPTNDQLIATVFNRNSMANDEGGTDDEEFRTVSVIDRVNTTFEVFQGITIGCVQCHSHPYEPIHHADFYRFLAFFNNSADADLPSDFPLYRNGYSPDNKEKVAKLVSFIQQKEENVLEQKQDLASVTRLLLLPQLEAEDCDDYNYGLIRENVLDWSEDGKFKDSSTYIMFSNLDMTGYTGITAKYKSGTGQSRMECRLDSINGPLMGQANLSLTGAGFRELPFPITRMSGVHDLFFVFSGNLSAHKGPATFDWFRLNGKTIHPDDPKITEAKKSLARIPRVKVPVMKELAASRQRKTHVLLRGNFLTPGPEVFPGIPAVYKFDPPGLPRNRLGVAQWLTSPDNPLTARVEVNRLWEQLFSKGIVETLEDFGSQGFKPTHPELLDWLAAKLAVDDKWSIKKTLKRLVMSATYRQSSAFDHRKAELDSRNQYLSHFPKSRLSAEQVRDMALDVSGLLSYKMYGPSVKPYQPENTWQVVYSSDKWNTSEGEDRYRRSVYTYWKRTSPYPSFLNFDVPSREVCSVRRINTNTPLQALTTLNDTVYAEAAIALAEKQFFNSDSDVGQILLKVYQIAIGEKPSSKTLDALKRLYMQSLIYYRDHPEYVRNRILHSTPSPEKAALSIVCNAILNLDAFITKS